MFDTYTIPMHPQANAGSYIGQEHDRTCIVCKKKKKANEFYLDSRGRYRRSICVTCYKNKKKTGYAAH
jgi:hypothetical protein